MADVITRLKVESSEYDSKIKRATQSLNEMTTAAEREGNKIATANKENIALAQSLGKMATVSSNTRGKMSELTAAIEAATIQYNRLSSAEKQGQFGRALNASIGQLQTRLAGLKTEMAAVQGQMGKTNMMGGMGGFGAGIKGGLAMMGPQAMGFAAVAGAAMGVKKVFSDMIGINKEFEQSTANLTSIMGKTTDEVANLTSQAKQLGATTRYTANEITELQTNLARLGFTQQEILNSTSAVQAFATATGAGLGEPRVLEGAALRGFGLSATEMERVASVLSVSTTKSALSFEKLATALPPLAPVAKQLGFSIEDTVTLLGKLSDAGFDASTAGTATRNIFLKMANDSGKLAQAMGRPVNSVEEFGDALKDMKDRGMSLNDILQMVGVRSTAAFAVFADNAGTLKDFKESITDCSEAMHEMEKKQIETLQGSITILNSAWEGLMLTFSESNGTIKKVVDGLTELLSAWTKWRNRNAGGDAAIQTYEVSEDNIKSQAKTKLGLLRGDVASGKGNKWFGGEKMSDDAILEQVNAENAALNKQIETLKKLEQEYQQYKSDLKTAQNSGDAAKAVSLMEKNPLKGTDYIGKSNVVDNIYKDIAAAKDKVRVNEYIASTLTPATAATETKGKGKGLGGSGGSLTAKSRADIEAQMQQDIAALDKVNMIKEGKEQEYEDKVFTIKAEAYDRIKKLYAEDSKEYSQMEAKIAQLTIQHQGTTLRLANKGTSKGKTYEAQTGPSGYSQEGISALRSEIQSGMKSMQMGSSEYMVEASRLVDLTTFENLLQASMARGMQLDPTMLEELFEKIDLGIDIKPEDWQNVEDQINEFIEGTDLPAIQLDVNTGNVKELDKEIGSLETNLNGAINVFGQLGDAMQQIDDPGAKVAGIIMGAIANIAGTFAASLKGTFTPWDWIAAAISGTATMISTIAAIKSSTKGYAFGGMVEGTSYSGDNIVARLNAGEGVLTQTGVRTAAAMADGMAGQQRVVVEGRISGKDILLSANNTNRAAGGSRGYYANVH